MMLAESRRDFVSQPIELGRDEHAVYHLHESLSEMDLREWSAVVERAWTCDYPGKARLLYDAERLRWFLQGPAWFVVTARNHGGTLCGFVLALPRTLFIGEVKLKTFLGTALSIDPAHRRTGVGRQLLAHFHRTALDAKGADLLVGTVDEGQRGITALKSAYRLSHPPLDIKLSRALSVWACTNDIETVHQYEPLEGMQKLARFGPLRKRLEFSPRAANGSGKDFVATRVSARECMPSPPPAASFGFLMEEDLCLRYEPHANDMSGTTRVEFATGSVTIAWDAPVLVREGLPSRRVAFLQLIQNHGATRAELITALRHMNETFLASGCLSTCVTQCDQVPSTVLLRAGFVPTTRRVRFAVWGPNTLVESIPTLDGTGYIDLQ
jgi:GNAT superfamily N-acetyltransferase